MKKIQYILITLLIESFIGHNCYGIEFESIKNPYKDAIIQMEEDQLGYMWIATDNGMIRYDGKKYTRYSQTDPTPKHLPSNLCLAIANDYKNRTWVGTSGGLSVYEEKSGQFEPIKIGKNNDGIRDIKEDTDHTLWLLGYNGLYHYNPDNGQTKEIRGIEGIRICIDKKNIWVSSEENGITIIDKRTKKRRQVKGISPHQFRLLTTSNGYIIAGSANDGVYILNSQGLVMQHLTANRPNGFNSNNISSLCEWNGHLLIGCINGNLASYNLKTGNFEKKELTTPVGIDNNSLTISSIIADKHHNLWIGTLRHGIIKTYQKGKIFRYIRNKGQKAMTSFCNDGKGNLWAGSDGNGLYIITGEKSLTTNYNQGQAIPHIRYRECELWIANWGNGVTIKEQNSRKEQQIKNLPGNGVHDVLPVKGGAWIAIDHYGLVYYDRRTNSTLYAKNSKIPVFNTRWGQFPTQLMQDHKGRIWAATSDGLCCWDGHTYKKYGYKNGIDQETITMMEDHLHRIWFISKRNGLNLLDEKKAKYINFNQRYRLPDGLKSMTEDKKGNLWICSSDRIYCINPSKGISLEYPLASEIGDDSFYPSALYIGQNGMLYAGTTFGMLTINLPQLNETPQRQAVTLTALHINNEKQEEKNIDITGSDTITLKHDEKHFAIEFNCINNEQPEIINYYYRLDGLSKEWTKADDNQEASFTGLNAGEYQIEVKALTYSGEIGQLTHNVTLIILPPWWETWWFRSLTALVLATIICLLIKYKTLKIEKQKEKLSLLVTERTQQLSIQNGEITRQKQDLEKKNAELDEVISTKDRIMSVIAHDLRNPVTVVAGMLELLNSDKRVISEPNLSQQICCMNKAAHHLQNEMENLLQWVRMKGDKILYAPTDVQLYTLVTDSLQLLQESIKNKKLEVKMTDYSQTSTYCDERMIATTIRNVIQNAIKFSKRASSIEITINEDDTNTTLEIKDHGVGMSAERCQQVQTEDNLYSTEGTEKEKGTGLGLKISQNFVSKNKGWLNIISEEGQGCTVNIVLPKGSIKKENKNEESSYQQENKEYDNDEQNRKIILIADDDQDLLNYLTLLFKEDYEVHTANNGTEAIKEAQETLPDIVLSDMMMPEMNGMELCKRLKSEPLTQHIPVLILTSNDTAEMQIESLETGADDYITKPFNKEVLKAKLRSVIQNNERKLQYYRGQWLNLKPGELPTSKEDAFMTKIDGLIKENISSEKLTVDYIADKTALSRMQLFRKVKAITRCAPSEYIKQYRLQYAAQLIERHSMDIQEVAYAVGFSDPKYFSLCFSEKFKMAPSLYAKKHNNKE